jgi:hypothetical protein
MYWAAPPLEKSSTIVTGLHVDANFFADALHACMEGYNEVVFLSLPFRIIMHHSMMLVVG